MNTFTTKPSEIKQLLNKGYYVSALKKLHKNAHIEDNRYRNTFIRVFKTWALPPTVDQLCEIYNLFEGLTVLEVGCGKGLWAAILASCGLNVIATDNKCEWDDYDFDNYYDDKNFYEYLEIESLKAEDALEKYGSQSDVLFVSWGRGFITKNDFDNFKGKYVVSIGEGSGGCTNNGYVDKLKNDPEWKILKEIDIPQWRWVHDWLTIYERL